VGDRLGRGRAARAPARRLPCPDGHRRRRPARGAPHRSRARREPRYFAPLRLAILTGLYVAVVCSAQVAANKIVLLPFTGLEAPGGVYLIGISLAFVQVAHYSDPSRREGAINAQAMNAMGFGCSGILAAYL